jgi:hypothetical protein
VFVLREQIAQYQTAAKKEKADDETDPPLFQQSLQLKPAETCPIRKIIVHRLFDQIGCIGLRRGFDSHGCAGGADRGDDIPGPN